MDAGLELLLANPTQASGFILVCAALLVMGMHTLARGLNEGRSTWHRRLRTRLGVEDGQSIGELRWMLLMMHLVLWPTVVWALLHVWGLHDRGHVLRTILFSTGFSLGSITVVPGKLLLGALYFLVLLTFTRWIKSKMERDWLPRTRVEASTRDSIAMVFGYVTFIIAAAVGLSVAGFNLTKLAIVAGALSVGIGFGLQNIVNNFISGLIILFERPVKQGDYVVVRDTQGFVRRIRIRSTEIRTWDRETIIVPNSDLLSNHLKNLNLADRYARVTVPVGVARGVDTAVVKRTLLAVAAEHPLIFQEGDLSTVSGPSVVFANFGASSLDFELRAFVRDSSKRTSIASDLRFAIDAAFRQAGIEMPLPQQEIRLIRPSEDDAGREPADQDAAASSGVRADTDRA